MLNAERFKEEINKHNNEFGLTDSIADCKTLECRNCRFSRLNNSDDEIILCSTRKVKWLRHQVLCMFVRRIYER